MQIAISKTRERFPLSPRKPLKKTISFIISWIFLVIFVYAVFAYIVIFVLSSNKTLNLDIFPLLGIGALLAFLLLLFIFIITYIYEQWYYAVYFYDLTDNFVVIRKGVITPSEITIPYERIQDVYVDQDILDRIFRLYDVHLSSATISSGMEAHIDGLEKPAADGLREMLLRIVSEKISKNAMTSQQLQQKQEPNV